MNPSPSLGARLRAADAILARHGFPPLSPFWRETLERFLATERRQLVLRVGRRGGKSSSLCRLAVVVALYGDHKIPPGDVGVVAFVSVSRDESAQRLKTIEAILRALEVPFRRADAAIELVGRPIVFKTYAASLAGVSGFTCILAVCDELAKWRDADTGANPAREVLASLRPTLATQPNARIVLSSSPFSTLDAHFEAFERGETPEQMTAEAPTWVANPTVTEEDTRALEPDGPTHAREYGAIPMDGGASAFFDARAVEAAVDRTRPTLLPHVPSLAAWAGADFGFRSDSSALAIVRRTEDGRAFELAALEELRPGKGAPLLPSAVVASFATLARSYGCTWVMADSHYREAMREALAEHRLALAPAPEGQIGKAETYVRARVLLHQGALRLPKHDRLIAQLKEVISKPTPGGGLSLSSPRRSGGGGHGDLVSALVLALWAAEFGAQRPRTTTTSTPRPFHAAWNGSAAPEPYEDRATGRVLYGYGGQKKRAAHRTGGF